MFDEIVNITKEASGAVLCIVVQTKGSTPRKVGTKMIVKEDGSIVGTIGGGNLERNVIEQALIQLERHEANTFKYDLVKELEMCCGGSVAVYMEPIMKTKKLYIFGAGHTGEALADIASKLDFEITLFDDRKDYIAPIKNKDVKTQLIDFDKDLGSITIDDHTYIVIMTYSHPVDKQILSYYVDKDLAYLGMIGSQRKTEVAKKMLKNEQLGTTQQIKRIDMPIGVEINAESPMEIAVSILAKLIAVKNG